jgi:WD40 repeat protein
MVGDVALSADGTRLAYTLPSSERYGKMDLWIRDTGDLRGEKLVPPTPFGGSMVFAPDGKSLYYLASDPAKPWITHLYQWPLSGGQPQKVAEHVEGRISFSPDGASFAFGRNVGNNLGDLIVRKVATGTERKLVTIARAWETFHVAWSPDGRQIACLKAGGELRLISIQTGEEKNISIPGRINALRWPAGGNLFAILGGRTGHIWRYDVAHGEWEVLSDGSERYAGSLLAAARDASTLAAVRLDDMMPVASWIANFFGVKGVIGNYANVVLLHPRR